MTSLEGLHEDFRDLLVRLVDAGVEFVIVGAYALAPHGAPRASGDIDLFVRPAPEKRSGCSGRSLDSGPRSTRPV